MTATRILWYFADPMCSWCWGFAPVISAIKETYPDRFRLALMMGGLRPGTSEPMSADLRNEILHHWREVHRLTGQPFDFEAGLPPGFVYDTEPACRAVIAMADIDPALTFAYFKSIQEAFYAQGRDVTAAATLADLAQSQHVATARFLERFEADEVKIKTRAHFQQTLQAGIRGFPTVVLQDEVGSRLLTHGYRPFQTLQPILEAWLDTRA